MNNRNKHEHIPCFTYQFRSQPAEYHMPAHDTWDNLRFLIEFVHGLHPQLSLQDIDEQCMEGALHRSVRPLMKTRDRPGERKRVSSFACIQGYLLPNTTTAIRDDEWIDDTARIQVVRQPLPDNTTPYVPVKFRSKPKEDPFVCCEAQRISTERWSMMDEDQRLQAVVTPTSWFYGREQNGILSNHQNSGNAYNHANHNSNYHHHHYSPSQYTPRKPSTGSSTTYTTHRFHYQRAGHQPGHYRTHHHHSSDHTSLTSSNAQGGALMASAHGLSTNHHRNRQQSDPVPPATYTCYHCGDAGKHYISACPQRDNKQFRPLFKRALPVGVPRSQFRAARPDERDMAYITREGDYVVPVQAQTIPQPVLHVQKHKTNSVESRVVNDAGGGGQNPYYHHHRRGDDRIQSGRVRDVSHKKRKREHMTMGEENDRFNW